jgi:hypothetical protein
MKNTLLLSLFLILGFCKISAQYNAVDFIPNNDTRTIYIPINFNIFRNSAGTTNFTNNETTRTKFREVITWMNATLANNTAPSDPVPGYILLPSAKIQFVYNDVYFYNDSANYNLSTGAGLTQMTTRIKSYDKNRLEQLNVMFNDIDSPVANGVGEDNGISSPYEAYVMMFNACSPNNMYERLCAASQTLTHEIMHLLGLDHTYLQGHEICDRTDPDFLDDVFLPYYDMSNCPDTLIDPQCDICWDNYEGDPYDPNFRSSNNIMGGMFLNNYYMSRKQIGRMHKYLHMNKISEYAYVQNPTTIFQNTSRTYEKPYKIYDNYTITNNSTVELNSTILLPKNGVLTIESGSTLVINHVTSVDNYKIIVKSGGKLLIKNTGIFKIINEGEVHVLCNGKICFESGAKFMPSTVDDNLYLHSGYVIPSGYVTNIVPYSGLGKVITSVPSILISGTQTVDKIYSGNTVSTSGSTTIPNSRKIYVWGENTININSGFQVQSGGYFEVNTINNSCQ